MTSTSPRRPLPRVPHPSTRSSAIRDLVYKVCGIFQLEEKLYLMADACGRRMKHLSVRTPREYWDLLTAHSSREAELRQLLNEVTIGETCLFRSPPQLDALRKVILPELVQEKNQADRQKVAHLERRLLHREEPIPWP